MKCSLIFYVKLVQKEYINMTYKSDYIDIFLF